MGNRDFKNIVPKWADKKAIKDFVRSKPDGYHLDHIIPVNGLNVCGLHVLENLQFIPVKQNLRKSSKLSPIAMQHAVCPVYYSKNIALYQRKIKEIKKSGKKGFSIFSFEDALKVLYSIQEPDESILELINFAEEINFNVEVSEDYAELVNGY